MDRIGLVGANSRTKNAELVARLSLPKSDRVGRLASLAREIGVAELVYIGTCNRVEVVFRGDGRTDVGEYRRRVFAALLGSQPRPGEAERSLSAWAGEGAVEHLFLVAAGLDSARLGEREIHHQVREALEMARQAGVSDDLLDHVVTKALRAAGRARCPSVDGEQPPSLAEIAVQHLLDRLRRTPGAVAVVGVSPMTRHCAARLAPRASKLLVVNRTAETGVSLAGELGGEYRSLDAFRAQPDEVEALLISTGCPGILFGRPELERLAARTPSCEPPLVVDMSVPPNTERAATEVVDVHLIDMDEILEEASADRDHRLVELAPARRRIDESLKRLRKSMAERALSPVLAQLHHRYRETAVEGVDRLMRKELAGLDEGHHEIVRRWAEVLARRLAHVPSKGLREIASEHGMSVVRTFLEASGEDFLSDSREEVLVKLEALVETDV